MATADEQAILDEGLTLGQFPPLERDIDYVINQYFPTAGIALIQEEAAAPWITHESSATVATTISADQGFTIAHGITTTVDAELLEGAPFDLGHVAQVAVGVVASSESTFSITSQIVANNPTYLRGNILNIPVWPFEANWGEDVRETLEWLTDIMRSPTGAEQRRILRKYPRRTFEFAIMTEGRAYGLFDRLMMINGARDLYLPLWHEAHISSGIALTDGDFIPCTTAQQGEIQVGDIIFISDGTPFKFEMAQVESITGLGITTALPLEKDWAPFARIHPARKARFTDQPEPRRHTDRLITAQVRFVTSQANKDVTPGTPILDDVYRDFGVLVAPPDEGTQLTYGYDRLLDELDNQTGVPFRRDTAGIAFPKQKYNWVLGGRAAHKKFRNMVYGLYGRAVPIWIPTFFADFDISESTPAGDSFIAVRNTQFHALGGAGENRRDICIEFINGTRLFRRIVSTAELSANEELLGVDAPFASGIDVNSVLRISFMTLSRLDQDQIEIVHRTDSAGVAAVTTTFRAAPNLRQVTTGV